MALTARSRILGLTTCLGAAALLGAGALPATAQEAGLEEIIVTARRVEENLQQVPITILAFSESTLQDQHITRGLDLDKLIPGIYVAATSTSAKNGRFVNIFSRGVRGVVPYFAEVPVDIDGNAFYFDVANVQMLKGPQGTLFGIAADAGAILYTPNKPKEALEAYIEGGAGNYGRAEVQGVVNVPVVADKLLVRVGGQFQRRDGFQRDLSTGADLGNENGWIGRAAVTLKPFEGFDNTTFLSYSHTDYHPSSNVLTLLKPTGTIQRVFGQAALNALAQQQALGPYTVATTGVPGGRVPFRIAKQLNVINTAQWELNDSITLKNIVGYQRLNVFQSSPTVFSALPLLAQPVYTLANGTVVGPVKNAPDMRFTVEQQLQGKAFDNRLTYVAGFIYDRLAALTPHTIAYSNTAGGIAGASTPSDSARSYGVYAQGTYDLGAAIPGLSFTAGFRETWDRLFQVSNAYSNAGAFLSSITRTGTYKAPSYTLQLSYQMTPQTLLFINNSKGYSRGGFNGGVGLDPAVQTYGPESLNNIEIGVKSDLVLAGMKSRLNVSGYYGFYDNLQVSVFTSFVNTVTGATQFLTLIRNAATAHLSGLEGDITIFPIDPLSINFQFAWGHGAYEKFESNGIDMSSIPLRLLPKLKYDISATYRLPVEPRFGSLAVSAHWSHRGSSLGTTELNPPAEVYVLGFGNLDADLRWTGIMGNDHFDGSLWVTNLTNQRHTANQLNLYDTLGFNSEEPAAPRMFGVRLRYRY